MRILYAPFNHSASRIHTGNDFIRTSVDSDRVERGIRYFSANSGASPCGVHCRGAHLAYVCLSRGPPVGFSENILRHSRREGFPGDPFPHLQFGLEKCRRNRPQFHQDRRDSPDDRICRMGQAQPVSRTSIWNWDLRSAGLCGVFVGLCASARSDRRGVRGRPRAVGDRLHLLLHAAKADQSISTILGSRSIGQETSLSVADGRGEGVNARIECGPNLWRGFFSRTIRRVQRLSWQGPMELF